MRPIAITMGDPSGIGGELSLKAWQNLKDSQIPFYCLDNVDRLQNIIDHLNLDTKIQVIRTPNEAKSVFPNALPVFDLPLQTVSIPGQLDSANGQTVLDSISLAVEHTIEGKAAAVVTNPIHKAALYETGFTYPGHTEYLAALGGENKPSIMMLACDSLRVIPVTIHQSLKTAIDGLTTEKIIYTAEIAHKALKNLYDIKEPRLAISGLNPHAGESGKMGHEDEEIIAPAITSLKNKGINAFGPLPADTMFHAEARANYDIAICMYHDQALIPIKTLDFHGGVNVTLGLPFIRTSPDHGTALDIAGKGIANPSSFVNAIKMAYTMAKAQQK
ncbi:4-hydroxythreonine-4-phosphate dehydrogenase PdxA [Curvivirga aplysinae]|uniref:4-hydroxythreonine-4-phosphate dehydrogenase PdxA n=1 Tax=Curvivirga aplysinae TaxID=2529852 RepID=UPI0012BC0D25|nr:4-hydroxythreonine-4-phosphate dehydrogenase PdxA [Curvivirga aplysinae]MTI10126.1 4-hydroxythreonine-4-phosphate dehydrogenase PdxA [Curvivirga aplysinae]